MTAPAPKNDPLVKAMLLDALVDATKYQEGRFKDQHDIDALMLPESTYQLIVQTPKSGSVEFGYSKFDLEKLAATVDAYYRAQQPSAGFQMLFDLREELALRNDLQKFRSQEQAYVEIVNSLKGNIKALEAELAELRRTTVGNAAAPKTVWILHAPDERAHSVHLTKADAEAYLASSFHCRGFTIEEWDVCSSAHSSENAAPGNAPARPHGLAMAVPSTPATSRRLAKRSPARTLL